MKRWLAVLLVLCLLLPVPVRAEGETGEESGEETVSEALPGEEVGTEEETGESTGTGEETETGEITETGEETDTGETTGTGETEPPEEAGETGPVYVPGQFTDVAEDSWYGTEGQGVIRRVWELGLMVGMGDGTFQPQGPLRLCEAVKLAAVLRSRALEDGEEFAPTEPWYQTYVDYAEAQGILQPGEFEDYTACASRGEMAHILAAALPEEQLAHINAIFAVPDVSSLDTEPVPYAEDILRLYRAGVLLGDAETHTFRPRDSITRAETAALAARLALPEERQRLELLPVNGASAALPEAALIREDGASLSLGYHSWEELFAFVGEEYAKESAGLFLSLDWEENEGHPVYGEEGSRIRAEYPGFTLEYLVADRDPLGVYVLRLESGSADLRDSRGIRTGLALHDLRDSIPELSRESGSSDPVLFSCVLGDPAVEYRYAVGWDGRVSGFSCACVGAMDPA